MQNQLSSRSKSKSVNLNSTADCSKMLLTKKGAHQAVRNHSCSIWSLFSTSTCQCSLNLQSNERSFNTVQDSKNNNENKNFVLSNRSEKVKFQADHVLEEQQNETKTHSLQKDRKQLEKMKKQQNGQKSKQKSKPQSKQPQKESQKQSEQTKQLKRYLVKQYLTKQIPYTRELSNTAFAKFYNKPCHQNYGFKNVKQNEFLYKNYMKTHNLTPHTLSNHPNQYQTFSSALKHGKRTKLDLQDKWKKIQRQLAKELNLNKHVSAANEQKKQKINNQTENKSKSSQKYTAQENKKRTKSEGKTKSQTISYQKQLATQKLSALKTNKQVLFLYKHTDEQGNKVVAKGRHGINCYVDNGFAQNQEAYIQFLKAKNPIYSQKVKKQDKNIDKIRIQNCKQSIQQNLPKHYLMPCMQYNCEKYSFRKNKKSA